MTLKELYQNIKANLELAGMKAVFLFNTELKDKPIGMPCAFVEFTSLPYNVMTDRTLNSMDIHFNVHIWFHALADNNLDFFDIRESVIATLLYAGYFVSSERQDTAHGEYMDWVIDVKSPFVRFDFSDKHKNFVPHLTETIITNET